MQDNALPLAGACSTILRRGYILSIIQHAVRILTSLSMFETVKKIWKAEYARNSMPTTVAAQRTAMEQYSTKPFNNPT